MWTVKGVYVVSHSCYEQLYEPVCMFFLSMVYFKTSLFFSVQKLLFWIFQGLWLLRKTFLWLEWGVGCNYYTSFRLLPYIFKVNFAKNVQEMSASLESKFSAVQWLLLRLCKIEVGRLILQRNLLTRPWLEDFNIKKNNIKVYLCIFRFFFLFFIFWFKIEVLLFLRMYI